MDRLTFSASDGAIAWLKREAKRIGISIGELLRRIVDEKRDTK